MLSGSQPSLCGTRRKNGPLSLLTLLLTFVSLRTVSFRVFVAQ